ncbi:MAG: glycosyltransferase [Oscillatoria sp. PMC 1068.18]|nr:glycosyltransferase [Oscillatoria sp. PMC 1068.18]
MKVLHVIPSVSLALGGPTQVVLNLVKNLRECGVEAEIATTNDDGKKLLDVPLNQRSEYEGVPVWFLPRFSPPLKEYIFSADLARWLWQNIPNYDLVHTHYLFSFASTAAAAIARKHQVPYLVRTIGQLTPWALAQSQLKKQVYTTLIERRNLSHAAAIHCTASGEATDVRNFGINTPSFILPLGVKKMLTLPLAPEKIRQKYGISPEIPIILFLSRLHYKKRPDFLIQALGKLAEDNYQFHLILAGSGEAEYINYLEDLATSLGVSSCTSFAGFVSGEAKELLLQGADLFVLPSFSENFGVAIAEAMAAGLPVIVTPGVQIAPEIASFEAGLVVDNSVEAVKEAIASLLTSPELRQQMGTNGKLLVTERYAWEKIANHLVNVYTSILEGKVCPEYFNNNI